MMALSNLSVAGLVVLETKTRELEAERDQLKAELKETRKVMVAARNEAFNCKSAIAELVAEMKNSVEVMGKILNPDDSYSTWFADKERGHLSVKKQSELIAKYGDDDG
jgi:outer membrane murein-binding lipoprotein Lpp